jgi:subtilisin
MTRYILLPRVGLMGSKELASLPGPPYLVPIRPHFAGGREIRILHSIINHGPKLVEMDDFTAREVNNSPHVRAMPDILDQRPRTIGNPLRPSGDGFPSSIPRSKGSGNGPFTTVTITVVKKGGESAGSGLVVDAFTNFSALEGDYSSTDKSGKVILQLSGPTIERLYSDPPEEGYWGASHKNIPVQPSIILELEPLSLNHPDCVRYYYGATKFKPATGVTVGVLDTGVGPHPDLNIIGGKNTVTGQNETEIKDVEWHGTHVAGLIGSCGTLYPALRGLAPGVPIRSYRIFGGFNQDAHSYALLRAMWDAEEDKCDILNISAAATQCDTTIKEALTAARDHGMLIVVAAGNDGRQPVDYPAAYPDATAVSAMGREGTFPSDAIEEAEIIRPPEGDDKLEFMAGFSNIGTEIKVIAPGVGILSTKPKGLYRQSSGTSMAAPVITGAAACLLSQRPDIYNMPRNRARSEAIEKLLFENCISRGFKKNYEGHGMPDRNKV